MLKILTSLNSVLIVVLLITGLCSVLHGNEISNRTVTGEVPKSEMVEKWLKFEKRMYQITDTAIKMILPRLIEAQDAVNFTSTCIRDSLILIRGLRNLRPWAIRLIDSSGKSIDGLLSGTFTSFGDYDQCLDTVVKREKSRYEDKILFHGKYCILHIRPPIPTNKSFDSLVSELKVFSERKTILSEAAKYADVLSIAPLKLGLCVPSGCSLDDINQLGKLIGDFLYFDVSTARCEVKTETVFSRIAVFVICAFSAVAVLVTIGSLLDLYCCYKKHDFQNTLVKLLLAFSLLTNIKKFKNIDVSDDTLKCLNGIRFLSMTWIMIAHTYIVLALKVLSKLLSAREAVHDFFFQVVINGTVAVDTFFCMAGFLVCYLTVKKFSEGRKSFSIRLYVIHRLWRILPVYACIIGLNFLLHLMGSGPIWHDAMETWIKNCHKNWWTNLLFINNFYDPKNMCCTMQGWFVACDMQLYISALFVLVPLLRWPKVGLSIAGSGVIASIVYSGVSTIVNDYPPTLLIGPTDPENVMGLLGDIYFKPFMHAGPYFVGMIAGYLLATRPKLQISKSFLVAGWCMAIITNLSVLYGTYKWNNGQNPTFWEKLFYSSFHRTVWALGVIWVIICCATGHGSVVNAILSWKTFIPLSRLTYLAFLLHPYIMIVHAGNLKSQLMFQQSLVVWIFFGHLCVTYALSFFGSMTVEAPCLQLEKIFFSTRKEKKTSAVFEQHSDLGRNLKSSKPSDIDIVVSADRNVANASNKTFVYKL